MHVNTEIRQFLLIKDNFYITFAGLDTITSVSCITRAKVTANCIIARSIILQTAVSAKNAFIHIYKYCQVVNSYLRKLYN